MIYTLTLNPAVDYLVRTTPVDGDRLCRTTEETLRVGGKGINVSRLLHTLGVPSVAWGWIAGFTGDFLVRSLEKEGLVTAFDRLSEGQTRINVKLLGDREINARGPLVGEADRRHLLSRLQALTADDCLLLCGSLPLGVDPSFYAEAARLAQARGATLVADTAGEALCAVLPYAPLLLKPNQQELQEWAQAPLKTEAERMAAAKALQAQGARYVLVSCGKDGALLASPDGSCLAMSAPCGFSADAANAVGAVGAGDAADAANAVGAGDAMLAGALFALQRRAEAEEILRCGIAAGSATALAGQPPTLEQIHAVEQRLLPARRIG